MHDRSRPTAPAAYRTGVGGHQIIAAAFGNREEHEWTDVKRTEQAEARATQQRNEAGDREWESEEGELELIGVVGLGAAVADIARVDELFHVDGDEVMAHEPEEIRRRDDCGRQHSVPEPARTEVMALGREDDERRQQARGRESDGVLREHADADGCADTDPVPLVTRTQQTSGKEGQEDPREKIEGGVLHQGAEYERHGERGAQGDGLGYARPAQFAGDEAGEDESDGVDDGGGEAQDLGRDSEERDGDAGAEGGERRIGDEAPLQVPRVVEELEFIPVKAVAVADGEVDDQEDGCEGAEQDCV